MLVRLIIESMQFATPPWHSKGILRIAGPCVYDPFLQLRCMLGVEVLKYVFIGK